MKFYLQSGLVLVAGILGAAAATAHADHEAVPTQQKTDCREAILRRFLSVSHSPLATYASSLIAEADSHHLDWRLLPSLAIVESGGGLHNRKNNAFGWDNGASKFATATEAIHHVAEALETARPYRGKNLKGKLLAYNRAPGYARLVADVMWSISPVSDLESAN